MIPTIDGRLHHFVVTGLYDALFVDATGAEVRGLEVRLDDGRIVRSGMLVGRDGKPQPAARPLQTFTRWYGFALTFPGCEVFGQ